MRTGEEILKEQLGKQLQNGLLQSYVYNGSVFDEINVLYLKFEVWLHLVADDETSVHKVKKEPELIEPWYNEDGDKSEYPLVSLEEKYPEFVRYLDKRLTGYKSLRFKDNFGSCGIKLIFDDNSAIQFYANKDGNSFIKFDNVLIDSLVEG